MVKKFLAASILICIVVCALTGCGSDSSSDKMEFEQLEWPTYENAKQIPIPQSTMADVRNKNSVRFDFYLANTTFEDYKAYVDECKAKGFTVDPIEQEYRYYAFNDDRYELTVQYQEGDIMYVCVVEERYDVEIKLLHNDKTSADMYDIRIEIDGSWEEDSEKGEEATTFSADLRQGDHTLVIENDDDDDICGRIDFTVTKDGEYFEYEIECLENEIIIRKRYDDEIHSTAIKDITVASPTEEGTTDVDVNQSDLIEETESQSVIETESSVTESAVEQVISVTEQAYTDAVNLTVNDLVKTEDRLGTSYSYQGLDLLGVDCEWIENPRNTYGTVESGAIYRKIAMVLEGFDIGNNWKGYAEWLIGYLPESRDEFAPYVENAIAFITTSDPLECVMRKFESLSSVTAFAYDDKVFSFEVQSLKECASEMQISEEMLGYIFAMLDEYGANTTFEGDSCVFYCKDYRS